MTSNSPEQIRAIEVYKEANQLRLKNKDLKALALYQEAIKLNPHLKSAQQAIEEILLAQERKTFQLTDIYIKDGEYKQAIQILNDLIAIHPNSWKAYKNLSLLYRKQKNVLKAIVELKRAIQIKPRLCGLYLTLGNYLDLMENFSAAIEEYKRALEINPKDMVVKKHCEQSFKLQKLFEGENAHENPETLVQIGNLFIEKQMPEKSVIYLKQALDSHPQQEIIHNSLGNCYYHLREFEQAIKHYEEALKLLSNRIPIDQTYFNLGMAYSANNNYKHAIQALTHCIEQNPYGKASDRAKDALEVLKLQEKAS